MDNQNDKKQPTKQETDNMCAMLFNFSGKLCMEQGLFDLDPNVDEMPALQIPKKDLDDLYSKLYKVYGKTYHPS